MSSPAQPRCEAFTSNNERCTRPATIQFETPGDAISVCNMHSEMLHRRRDNPRPNEDDELIVRRWKAQA